MLHRNMLSNGARRRGDLATSNVLTYWRTWCAYAFDDFARAEVIACVDRVSSIDPQWRAALAGDPAAAAGIALNLLPIARLSKRVDLAMTILLARAFDDAGAAFVLDHVLQRVPAACANRIELAASWRQHHRRLRSRIATLPKG